MALPNNALALFFTVVEMGKLRLVQSLQFISRHVPPKKWSLLYSNVDNMIILLEGAASLDEAILLAVDSPRDYDRYLQEKSHFVAKDSQNIYPGQLKLEWICNSPSWKFITCRLQNYILREEEDNDDDDKEEKKRKEKEEEGEKKVAGEEERNEGKENENKKQLRPDTMRLQKTAGLNRLSNKIAFDRAYSLLFGCGNRSNGTAVQHQRLWPVT